MFVFEACLIMLFLCGMVYVPERKYTILPPWFVSHISDKLAKGCVIDPVFVPVAAASININLSVLVVIRMEYDWEPVLPSVSITFTVTLCTVSYSAGGTHVILPVDASIDIPGGACCSCQLNGYVPPSAPIRTRYSIPGYANLILLSSPVPSMLKILIG